MAKHFYHQADQLVLDSLENLSLTCPDILLDKERKTVWLKSYGKTSQVAVISGGGAGHEPAHAGFVGSGLLAAAVSGNIFASPSVAQIVSAISRVAGPAGTLLVIMNYTGDVFHFHLAAEKAKAATGFPVDVLVVGDDVAVGRTKSGKVGRRGLAGTVLVNKIMGAYVQMPGVGVGQAAKLGKEVVDNLVTVGTALGHVHIPGRPKSSEEGAAPTIAELGMGIHNEPGCRVLDPQPALPELINIMLDQLLDMNDPDRAYVDFSDAKDIVLMVNNLGGVSLLEFTGITTNVIKALAKRNVIPSRVLSGAYMTSLDGSGFSITLLKATEEMVSYIDAPADAIGWVTPRSFTGTETNLVVDTPFAKIAVEQSGSGVELDPEAFKGIIRQACMNILDAEKTITEHDTIVGDGDCGVTLARGATAVMSFLDSPQLTSDAATSLVGLSNVIEDNMDGTSGAIYSIFMASLASELRQKPSGRLSAANWISLGYAALRKLQQATPARQGDRTLMDALEPFVESIIKDGDLSVAVSKARQGVAATKGMKAAFGRATYVEDSHWSMVPDPGAEGILCILEAFVTK